MKVLDLPLEEVLGEGKPHLTAYLQEKMPADPADYRLPAVMIYPGGGYRHLSPREAEPIAMEFAARGYQTFILYYSLAPRRYPQPLLDGAKAMTLIRDRAEEWNVDPHRIAICGFSAGGHAAALLGCLWKDPVIEQAGFSCEKVRPDAVILGYPVITAKEDECHPGSFVNLLGEEEAANPQLRQEMSLETRVTADNPPTFLWHTAADQAVPVASSLYMAKALADHHVPFELHVYPNGSHGLALANRRTSGGNAGGELPEVAGWIGLACNWLERTMN